MIGAKAKQRESEEGEIKNSCNLVALNSKNNEEKENKQSYYQQVLNLKLKLKKRAPCAVKNTIDSDCQNIIVQTGI